MLTLAGFSRPEGFWQVWSFGRQFSQRSPGCGAATWGRSCRPSPGGQRTARTCSAESAPAGTSSARAPPWGLRLSQAPGASLLGLAVLQHVLTPRVKATHVAFDSMKDYLDAVYDVTVAFEGTVDGKGQRKEAPSMVGKSRVLGPGSLPFYQHPSGRRCSLLTWCLFLVSFPCVFLVVFIHPQVCISLILLSWAFLGRRLSPSEGGDIVLAEPSSLSLGWLLEESITGLLSRISWCAPLQPETQTTVTACASTLFLLRTLYLFIFNHLFASISLLFYINCEF